jgi:hypothetical protein
MHQFITFIPFGLHLLKGSRALLFRVIPGFSEPVMFLGIRAKIDISC